MKAFILQLLSNAMFAGISQANMASSTLLPLSNVSLAFLMLQDSVLQRMAILWWYQPSLLKVI